MAPTGKGSSIEKLKIEYLSSDNILRTRENYKAAWYAMFRAGFSDVQTHCRMISNSLSNTKYPQLKTLDIPSIPAEPQKCHLTIPAIAFVITKLFKTFDTKLEKASQRSLNGSHSKDWVRPVRYLQLQVAGNQDTNPYSFMITKHKYQPLSGSALQELELLLDASAGSGNVDNLSDYVDASSDNPSPVRR